MLKVHKLFEGAISFFVMVPVTKGPCVLTVVSNRYSTTNTKFGLKLYHNEWHRKKKNKQRIKTSIKFVSLQWKQITLCIAETLPGAIYFFPNKCLVDFRMSLDTR